MSKRRNLCVQLQILSHNRDIHPTVQLATFNKHQSLLNVFSRDFAHIQQMEIHDVSTVFHKTVKIFSVLFTYRFYFRDIKLSGFAGDGRKLFDCSLSNFLTSSGKTLKNSAPVTSGTALWELFRMHAFQGFRELPEHHKTRQRRIADFVSVCILKMPKHNTPIM